MHLYITARLHLKKTKRVGQMDDFRIQKFKIVMSTVLHAHTSLTVLRSLSGHCAHIAKWVLFAVDVRFNGLKSLVLKIAMLKMHANDTFLWPRSTATSREPVTVIETIIQNLVRFDKFQPDNCVYQYYRPPIIGIIVYLFVDEAR